MQQYTYLALDLFTLLGPLALSFDKKVAFWRWWKPMLWGLLPTAAFFIFWDVLFTRWDIWSFNTAYLAGPFLFDLPLEEWLFFAVVPYACTFIYACIKAYGRWTGPDRGMRLLVILGFALLAAGGVFSEKAYTLYAFGGSGAGCILTVVLRRLWPGFRADTFLVSYLIILVPFFLVNGVLTALPVIRYNDAENLGIRMYTIPFEDTFYGLLLVLGNVVGTEWARARAGAYQSVDEAPVSSLLPGA